MIEIISITMIEIQMTMKTIKIQNLSQSRNDASDNNNSNGKTLKFLENESCHPLPLPPSLALSLSLKMAANFSAITTIIDNSNLSIGFSSFSTSRHVF